MRRASRGLQALLTFVPPPPPGEGPFKPPLKGTFEGGGSDPAPVSGCQLQTSYEFLQLHHHLVRIPHSVSGLHMFGLLLDESQQCGSFSGIRQPALLDFVGAHRQTPALPLSLFCFASLLDGETHIWLESAFRLLSGCFCVLFCFLFAMLHEHRCQCRFYFKLLLHMQRPSLRSRSAIPEEKKDEQPQEAPPAALGLRLSTFFFPRVWPMSHCGSVLT